MDKDEALRIAMEHVKPWDGGLSLAAFWEEADYWCVSFQLPDDPGGVRALPARHRVEVNKATGKVRDCPQR